MATYFVASGGSNTAPYDTWAKAATSLQTALTAASTDGDVVAIQYDGVPSVNAEQTVDTTYTFAANISLISSTNSGTSTITPTQMGTSYWIGNSTANRLVNMAGAFRVFCYGITLHVSGSTGDSLVLAVTDGAHFVYEDCYLWNNNTSVSSPAISVGNTDAQVFVHAKNCTFHLNQAAARIAVASKLLIEGGSLATTGTIPTGGLFVAATNDPAGAQVDCYGFDLSYLGSNAIVGNATTNAFPVRLTQCKLGTAYTAMATQTHLNRSSAELFIFDCASDDTHGLFGYHNAMGSVVSNTGIKYTGGAAAQSWGVTTTANCSFATPFTTPWVNLYHSGTSAITPWFEVLRDGSATAYTNAQVWGEFGAKVTTGSTAATLYHDRQALVDWAAGTAGASQASGTDTWDGENATHWAGKVDSGSAMTPAEAGDIRGRVVVGAPSITVYVDPYIRT